MDQTHIHLLLNHFPILGTFFGLCLLIYGFIKKKADLENAGFTTLLIVALLSIPAYLSGEEAEETVEHIPEVSEYYMELHEELAETALWMMLVTGGLSLIALIVFYFQNKRIATLRIATIIFASVTFVVMAVVGSYGGKIRHSELRGDTTEQVHDDDDH